MIKNYVKKHCEANEPNVVRDFLIQKRFYHRGKDQTCLAMDYCPGGELFMLLRSRRRFDLGTAKFYAMNIILGLEALHQLGVVYRE